MLLLTPFPDTLYALDLAQPGLPPKWTYTPQANGAAEVTTWPPSAWQQGGGGLAGPLVLDPASGLVFQQTGHPAPWNHGQREGENRWTSGIFARDPATGAGIWFDPLNPHDPFNLGGGRSYCRAD